MGLKRMESGPTENPDTANTALEGQERADQLAKENAEKQKQVLEAQKNSPENPQLAEAQKNAIDGAEARKNREREKILSNTQNALGDLKKGIDAARVEQAGPAQIRNATKSIAEADLASFQSKMRPDEVRQSANELTGAANAYKMEVEKILSTNLNPKERTKQLETAHEAFEASLKEIRGVIEAEQSSSHEQNAKAARERAEAQKTATEDFAERLAKTLAEQAAKPQQAKQEKGPATNPGANTEAPKAAPTEAPSASV